MDSGKFGPPMSSSGSGDDAFGYFGGTAPTTSYGTPVDQPPSRSRPRWLPVTAAAVVVALVGGGAWYLTHRDALVLPDHLGALQLTSTPAGANTGQVNIQTNQGNLKSVVGAYGPVPAKTALVVARGDTVSNGLAGQAALNGPEVTHYGPVSCAQETGLIICIRIEADLAVIVQTGTPGVTEPQAADFVQQAWAAQ
jgi:hypothetical protein